MAVPFVDLKRQNIQLNQELHSVMDRVINHAGMILGNEVDAFEKKLSNYLGVKESIGVNSGTDALVLILNGFGITKGDEVIVPTNSFFATAGAVVAAGGIPVCVDINDTLNIDPDCVKNAINSNTKAIIAVHLTGAPADMETLGKIAKDNNLLLIEDSAQAIGAHVSGKKIGAIGDASAFSFHPLKNLAALGDGGAITTNNIELSNKIRALRNHGLEGRDSVITPGINSRLDAFQAGILDIKLDHLDEWNQKKIEIAATYSRELPKCFRRQTQLENAQSVFHLYVARIEKRDEVKEAFARHEIGTAIHYPQPIHMQPAYKDFPNQPCPQAEIIADQILSLPNFIGMTDSEVNEVIEAAFSVAKELGLEK